MKTFNLLDGDEELPQTILNIPYNGKLIKVISKLHYPNVSWNTLVRDDQKDVIIEISTVGAENSSDNIKQQIIHEFKQQSIFRDREHEGRDHINKVENSKK